MKSPASRSFFMLVLVTILCINLTPLIVDAEESKDASPNQRTSRVAVVTGSNKGIGFAIVKGLCQQFNGIVYLTARNEKLGQAAVQKLNKIGLRPKFHQLDVTNDSSIQKFKNYLYNTYGGLDILVNNAAVAYMDNTTEPIRNLAANCVGVNYFGLLSVSKALFPVLKPYSRVVHMSSIVGHLSYVPGEQLKAKLSSPDLTENELSQLMRDYIEATKIGIHQSLGWSNNPYSTSKVGVAALTRIQQREFDKQEKEDIVVNAVHPGFVATDMTFQEGYFAPERGAQGPIYLALLPNNTDIRGKFVWHDQTVVDWINGTFPTPY